MIHVNGFRLGVWNTENPARRFKFEYFKSILEPHGFWDTEEDDYEHISEMINTGDVEVWYNDHAIAVLVYDLNLKIWEISILVSTKKGYGRILINQLLTIKDRLVTTPINEKVRNYYKKIGGKDFGRKSIIFKRSENDNRN